MPQKFRQVWSPGAPPKDDSSQGREPLGSQTDNFLLPWAFPWVSTQPAAFLHQVDDLRLAEAGQVESVALQIDCTQSRSQHNVLFSVFLVHSPYMELLLFSDWTGLSPGRFLFAPSNFPAGES